MVTIGTFNRRELNGPGHPRDQRAARCEASRAIAFGGIPKSHLRDRNNGAPLGPANADGGKHEWNGLAARCGRGAGLPALGSGPGSGDRTFALRYVGDASHAEDVVNETFFAVWQQAAAFQNRSAVGTWVLGIARFRALSLRQRLRETAEPLDDEIATNLPDPALGPDAVLERSNLTSVLRACLHALPLEQARLIDLVYLNEKPIREAARTIGIPLNTVKSRMFQARKKLAVLLSNAGIEPAPAGRGAW
jgi:RNA polymerase sigma-70 factor (ECF subfamily)